MSERAVSIGKGPLAIGKVVVSACVPDDLTLETFQNAVSRKFKFEWCGPQRTVFPQAQSDCSGSNGGDSLVRL